MSQAHHTVRRTTKLREDLFSKLGPLCEYTQLLKKAEWTEPLHLVHEMELNYCVKCNGFHWYIVELVEYDHKEYLVDWKKYDHSEIENFMRFGQIVDTSRR